MSTELELVQQDNDGLDIIPPKPTDVKLRAGSQLEWNGQEWKQYTTKQVLFVECFMRNGYKSPQAYAQAGYIGKPLRDCQQIYNEVVDLISYRTQQVAKKINGTMTPEQIMATLTRAVHMGMGDSKTVLKFDPAAGALVPETDHNGNVLYKFDGNTAVKGLELLGKAYGMWIDKIKVDNGIDDVFLSRLDAEQMIQLETLFKIGSGEIKHAGRV